MVGQGITGITEKSPITMMKMREGGDPVEHEEEEQGYNVQNYGGCVVKPRFPEVESILAEERERFGI